MLFVRSIKLKTYQGVSKWIHSSRAGDVMYDHFISSSSRSKHLFSWLTRHSSLSSIAPGMSSRLRPMSIQSFYRYILAGRSTLARPCEGFHTRTSLMSSSLFLQQFLARLVRLIWMVLEIGGRWPYNYCFVGCCFQDLFNIPRSVHVQFPSNFFSIHFVSIYVVYPCSRIHTTTAWKKLRFSLDFHMVNNLSIVIHALALSVDGTLLPRYVNLSTNFKEPPFTVKMSSFLKIKTHDFCCAGIYVEAYTSCCLL